MGASKAEIKGASKFMVERLFMRNGAVFTITFMRKVEAQRDGAVTQYLGANGLFLGEARESEVACRASLDIPVRWGKVPGGPTPDSPQVDAQVFPAGSIEVSGYSFGSPR